MILLYFHVHWHEVILVEEASFSTNVFITNLRLYFCDFQLGKVLRN